MSSITEYNSIRIIENVYSEELQDKTKDLIIKYEALTQIKALFKQFRDVQWATSLNHVVEHLEKRYGYDHVIFLYESNTFPCEIMLFRPQEEEGVFPFELDEKESSK